MSRPRLLDLFCGAGGASMGYHRAGFDVVGVDIRPQPHYPFEFIQRDALDIIDLTRHGECWLEGYVAIHASPPCQHYSTATKRNGTEGNHPDLIGLTRELLQESGLPWVIENVVGAPLIDPALVCGSMFPGLNVDGYRLRRHRLIETNWGYEGTGCGCDHLAWMPVLDVSGGGPTSQPRRDGGGGRPFKGTAAQARAIMGMPWATKAEVNEAIPPAYTEHIGRQLAEHLSAVSS